MTLAPCTSYYKFTACCDGSEVRFCKGSGSPTYSGVFLYDGTSYNGGNPIPGFGGQLEAGKCYTVSTLTTISGSFSYPLFTTGMAADMTSVGSSCDDPECPSCPKKVIFTPCCPGEPLEFRYIPGYPTDTDVYQYTGAVLIFDGNGNALIPFSCFTVQTVNTTLAESLALPPGPAAPDVDPAGKECGNYFALPTPCADCNRYYEVTNCADPTETYCTTSNLSSYINNLIVDPTDWPVIQILEKPGKCFYVEQIVTCSSPIPITPNPAITPFVGCNSCQASIVVYYELINCNDPEVIVYTSTDLSQYVGDYITLDEYEGVCFYVSVAQGLVPSDIPVTPTGDSFDSCAACSLPTYKLDDCAGIKDDVITNTDLSAYVGEVIVIDSCPDTCWFVQETEINAPLSDVFVNESFTTCQTCLVATLPAICVSFELRPGLTSAVVYVVNTNGASIEIVLNSENPYVKGCYLSWRPGDAFIVTEFGDCIDNSCPEIPQPKRKVTPGYDTPTCTPEYYEKVECNYSEWMYKQVLEERYGISNCCPEELMKWEIKHEMLMLDSLINPDYDCQPPIDCGCPQPTTCGCSCNSRN